MDATQLDIVEKHRQIIPYVASLKDFTYTAGTRVDPIEILDNPQISLYCFDDDSERAIFVELPGGVALTDVPFVYLTQAEQALHLIALSYGDFIALGDKLPEIQNPIFVHMTGRSGSTLLSHAFNESMQVASLSEPDCITQFAHFREQGKNEAWLRTLADKTMRFLFKDCQKTEVFAHAVKSRNEGIRVIELFQTTFSQGKSLFLYRDALSFIASFYRLWRACAVPEQMPLADWMALFAFQRDSQAGTTFARDDSKKANELALTKPQVNGIEAILQRHPVLHTSDFIAPQTLKVPRGQDRLT